MTTTPELILVLDTAAGDAMGYGYTWPARVREVVSGALPDDAVLLHTMDADLYQGRFRNLKGEPGVRVGFRRRPTMPAALQGFVARDGTIWEIVEVAR